MSDSYQRQESNQNAPRDIATFLPLINKYAFKFQKRAEGLTSAFDMDDIKQEMCLVFVKCSRAYDETKGGSFMNFLISAWYNEINGMMRKDQRNRDQGMTLSEHVECQEDEGRLSLFDVMDSGWPNPEQNMEAYSCMNYALSNLTDPARVLVETLLDPPESIRHQFDIRERGVAARRAAGRVEKRSIGHMNLRFLTLFFDLPANLARSLRSEIEGKMSAAFEF